MKANPAITDLQKRRAWYLHLSLAILFPILAVGAALLGDFGGIVFLCAASLYGVAPLLGYALLLVEGLGTAPNDAPCKRTGTFLGYHWFEFKGFPERRFWTADDDRAAVIRTRPAALLVSGLDGEVGVTPNNRQRHHVEAGKATVLMVSTGMVVALTLTLLPLSLLSMLDSAETTLIVLVQGGLCAAVSLCVFFLTYWATFWLSWGLWNRVLAPRRAEHVSVSNTLLKVDGVSMELSHPSTTAQLGYHARGVRMDVSTPSRTVLVHGDFDPLAPVVHWMNHRQVPSADDHEQLERALHRLRRSFAQQNSKSAR